MNGILTTANELKYSREIKRILGEQLNDPTEEFVKLFVPHIYSGRLTPSAKEQFTQITKRAFRGFINDQINDRLKTALGTDAAKLTQQAEPLRHPNQLPP